VGTVKIYYTNEKITAAGGFRGHKVKCALSFYGYTFCIAGEDLVEYSL
jgi:hypothetical protein